MNPQFIQRILNNADEEDIQEFLSKIDISKIVSAVGPHLQSELEPHLQDVRQRAQNNDVEMVRERFQSKSQQEQEQMFWQTVSDIAMTIKYCKHTPQDGFARAKDRLRDPTVYVPLTEAVEEEWFGQEEARGLLMYIGHEMFPEMYTDQERTDLEEELNG